jgi:hypothetical protein
MINGAMVSSNMIITMMVKIMTTTTGSIMMSNSTNNTIKMLSMIKTTIITKTLTQLVTEIE